MIFLQIQTISRFRSQCIPFPATRQPIQSRRPALSYIDKRYIFYSFIFFEKIDCVGWWRKAIWACFALGNAVAYEDDGEVGFWALGINLKSN